MQVKQNVKFFVKAIDKANAAAYNRSIKPRPDERGRNVKKGIITMKKALALMLAVAFCAACFVLTTGAAAPADEFSLLPQENGKAPVTVTGGKLTYNADGSVTLTLEDTSATIAVEYTKDGTVEEEKKINMKEDGKYIVLSYVKTGSLAFAVGSAGTDGIEVIHDRKDGTDKQLMMAGMNAEAAFGVKDHITETTYAWDWQGYLNKDEGKRMPEDGIINIKSANFRVTGAVGDTLTLYRFSVVNTIPEDLGDEAEAWKPADESSEPADESSAAASEAESSAATSSAAASSTTVSSKTPVTSDAGVAAIVVLAVVAAAGAAVVIRKRG